MGGGGARERIIPGVVNKMISIINYRFQAVSWKRMIDWTQMTDERQGVFCEIKYQLLQIEE